MKSNKEQHGCRQSRCLCLKSHLSDRSWELPDEGKSISRARSVLEMGASTVGTPGPRSPTWHRHLSASAPARRPLPTGGCVSCCCRSPACRAHTPARLGCHRGIKGSHEYPPLSAITQGVLLTARPLIDPGRAAGVFYSPIPSVFTECKWTPPALTKKLREIQGNTDPLPPHASCIRHSKLVF